MSVYTHIISKIDADRNIKFDIEMLIYTLGSKVKVMRHKKQCWRGFLHSCECRLLLVGMVIHLDLICVTLKGQGERQGLRSEFSATE